MILSNMQGIGLTDWIEQLNQSIGWLLPEFSLVITLLLLIVFDLLFKNNKSIGLTAISFAGLAFTGVLLFQQFQAINETVTFFNQMLKLSELALVLKTVFIFSGLVVLILMTQQREGEKETTLASSENLVMVFTILIGAFLMTMTMNLILIYLGIELVSIGSYIITALNAKKERSEAALKYLIFGAVASALMLYGMSWLYGFTGTLQLDSMSFYAGLTEASIMPLGIALVLTLSGFLFKLSAFPMHIWSPDVYEAAPTPVVALFSVVPKLAALAIIFRISTFLNINWDWQFTLGIVAMASMLVGNLSALWQKDAKRMLAYSSIAHAGFLLLGIISQSETGNDAFLFYALVYALMSLAAFALVQYFEHRTGTSNMERWKGLGKSIALPSILMLVVMIALTGLPPTVGFNAKLYAFSALWESYQLTDSGFLLWLFIVGLFNTVVSLFYYLKLPYFMFIKNKEETEAVEEVSDSRGLVLIGTLLVMPLLLLFFRSDWFVDLVNTINFAF